MIESIFHVNVNCTDFARSLEFYVKLGFKVVRDLEVVDNPELSAGLRIPSGRGRAVLLMLGDNPRATRLDLIEWLDPRTAGAPIQTSGTLAFVESRFAPESCARTMEI